jgi:hypothetical protein
MVVQLLLELEGLAHVALGFIQRLGEVPDGGVPVLRLGEHELLLAGLDGVVGLDQQRTALSTQLLNAQRSQRVHVLALGPIAGTGRLTRGLLALVAEVQVGACTACGHNACTYENSRTGAVTRDVAASAACCVTDCGCSIDCRLGVIVIGKLRTNGLALNVFELGIGDLAAALVQGVLAGFGGNCENQGVGPEPGLFRHCIRPCLPVTRVLEPLDGDDVEHGGMLGSKLLDGVLDLTLLGPQNAGGVHNLCCRIQGDRVLGPGRAGRHRKQARKADHGECTYEL